MQFSRVLYASNSVPGRNILLFVNNFATYLQNVTFLQNIKLVYYPPGEVVMWSSLEGCRFQFLHIWDNELATHDISSIGEE